MASQFKYNIGKIVVVAICGREEIGKICGRYESTNKKFYIVEFSDLYTFTFEQKEISGL